MTTVWLRVALLTLVVVAGISYPLAAGESYQGSTNCSVKEHGQVCHLERAVSRNVATERELRKLIHNTWNQLDHNSEALSSYVRAPQLAERLANLGLPLTGAIVLDRHSESKTGARPLRIAALLAASGDFNTAVEVMDKYQIESELSNLLRLDFLTLLGRYRQALELYQELELNELASAASGRQDYWSNDPLTIEALKTRAALTTYLAGDLNEALDSLTDEQKRRARSNPDEQERYFLALRRAQIMIAHDPEKAHRLAEDVAYLAQSRNWPQLEYAATVLDGWARFFMDKHYHSLVNFIKASGILPRSQQPQEWRLSHRLGLLAARLKMRPRGNYSKLQNELIELVENRPWNRSLALIRYWLPSSVDYDFVVSTIHSGYYNRKHYRSALNYLLQSQSRSQEFFAAGENPGGVRGVVNSLFWLKELRRSGYLREFLPESEASIAVKRLAERRHPRRSVAGLNKIFNRRDFYLFSFPLGDERVFYLQYRGAKIRKVYQKVRGKRKSVKKRIPVNRVAAIKLSKSEAEHLRETCRLSGDSDCISSSLKKFNQIIGKFGNRNALLQIHYQPDFDLNYKQLLPGSRALGGSLYFARLDGDASALRGGELYFENSCTTSGQTATPGSTEINSYLRKLNSSGNFSRVALSWPARLTPGEESANRERPAYLRRFDCNGRPLRLWDLERHYKSGGPQLVVTDRLSGELKLRRALVDHFAGRETVVVERGLKPGGASEDYEFWSELFNRQTAKLSSAQLIRRLSHHPVASGYRLILPAPVK